MNRERTIQTILEDEEFDVPVLGKTLSKSAPSSPRQGAPCSSHEIREETISEMIDRQVREAREQQQREDEEREAKRLEDRRKAEERAEATRKFIEDSRATLAKSEQTLANAQTVSGATAIIDKKFNQFKDDFDASINNLIGSIAGRPMKGVLRKEEEPEWLKVQIHASEVGRALSINHAKRMKAHEGKKTVMTEQQRIRAIGPMDEFSYDPLTTYMSVHAEEVFEPKRILSKGDWLSKHREPDQRFEQYKQGKGHIVWLSPGKNMIYLFISDNSFTNAQIEKYRLYANAFFTGARSVDVIKAGGLIPGSKGRRVPKTFLETEVQSRNVWGDTQYRTCGDRGILFKLKKYRPDNSYAMLCITMKDLYPGPNWGYCFGWASYNEGVGAFSFLRYDPSWDGIEDPDKEKNMLMRGCHIMCHEIGHQFGLRHCIYYECLMNGVNSPKEQRDGGIKLLCPVCQRKLQQNLKFDAKERFLRLADACDTLGFDEEAAIYRKLLHDAETSGIVATPKNAQNVEESKNTLNVPTRNTGAGSSQRQRSTDVRTPTNSTNTATGNRLRTKSIENPNSGVARPNKVAPKKVFTSTAQSVLKK